MAGELSPALLTRTRRFARHSWQSGASSPRPWCDTRTLHRPLAPRTGRSTDRFCPDQDHDHQEEEEAEDHELPNDPLRLHPTTLASRPLRDALLFLLAYRPALLAPVGSLQKGGVTQFQRLAPPCLSLHPTSSSCGKLPERRRYPFPAPRSYEPTNDERSPPCGAWEKQVGKSARHRYTLFFFLGVFGIPW